MKVILNSTTVLIEKEVLTVGTNSKKPTERSECSLKIEEIDINDKTTDEVVRSEYLKSDCKETRIIIGDGSSKIDEYIERVIQTMSISEKSLVKITLLNLESQSSSSSVLIHFKITLIDCDLRKPIWEWTAREKYEVALSYKEIGIGLYKSLKIVEAFSKFSRSCKILITLEPMEDINDMGDNGLVKDVENLRKILYNNMAECQLIRGNYELAILLCDKVLRRDEDNVKALYRRAVAHENLRDYENALIYMEKVVHLEPRNSASKERAIMYRKKVGEANKSYDNIVRKMFNV